MFNAVVESKQYSARDLGQVSGGFQLFQLFQLFAKSRSKFLPAYSITCAVFLPLERSSQDPSHQTAILGEATCVHP